MRFLFILFVSGLVIYVISSFFQKPANKVEKDHTEYEYYGGGSLDSTDPEFSVTMESLRREEKKAT